MGGEEGEAVSQGGASMGERSCGQGAPCLSTLRARGPFPAEDPSVVPAAFGDWPLAQPRKASAQATAQNTLVPTLPGSPASEALGWTTLCSCPFLQVAKTSVARPHPHS